MSHPPTEKSTVVGTAPTGALSTLAHAADHWGLLVTYGGVTMAIGLVLALWPGETLVVVTVLVSVQLVITGVIRIGLAVVGSATDSGVRTLVGITGVLAVIVGLVILRDPLRTLTVVGLVLGVWWLVAGLVDLITAAWSPGDEGRGLEALRGLVTAAAGGLLLLRPGTTLELLVVVVCTWLFAYGFMAIVAGLVLRRSRTSGSTSTTPPATS